VDDLPARKAADTAGLAFDVFATHLDGDRLLRTPDGQQLRGGDAGRAGMAELDALLACPLRAGVAQFVHQRQMLPAVRAVVVRCELSCRKEERKAPDGQLADRPQPRPNASRTSGSGT
jgi:hypothetical protein